MNHNVQRKALAAAIATHTAKLRDLHIAERALSQAATRHWEACAAAEELAKGGVPAGSLAAELATCVANGTACSAADLERHAVNTGKQVAAAENDAKVWEATADECVKAVRAKEIDVAEARAAVARHARSVICNHEHVEFLVEELAMVQAQVISKRSVLRFIWGHGINGEMPRALADRIEKLLWRDLAGHEPAHEWEAALETLMANPDAELPLVPERRL